MLNFIPSQLENCRIFFKASIYLLKVLQIVGVFEILINLLLLEFTLLAGHLSLPLPFGAKAESMLTLFESKLEICFYSELPACLSFVKYHVP